MLLNVQSSPPPPGGGERFRPLKPTKTPLKVVLELRLEVLEVLLVILEVVLVVLVVVLMSRCPFKRLVSARQMNFQHLMKNVHKFRETP